MVTSLNYVSTRLLNTLLSFGKSYVEVKMSDLIGMRMMPAKCVQLIRQDGTYFSPTICLKAGLDSQ